MTALFDIRPFAGLRRVADTLGVAFTLRGAAAARVALAEANGTLGDLDIVDLCPFMDRIAFEITGGDQHALDDIEDAARWAVPWGELVRFDVRRADKWTHEDRLAARTPLLRVRIDATASRYADITVRASQTGVTADFDASLGSDEKAILACRCMTLAADLQDFGGAAGLAPDVITALQTLPAWLSASTSPQVRDACRQALVAAQGRLGARYDGIQRTTLLTGAFQLINGILGTPDLQLSAAPAGFLSPNGPFSLDGWVPVAWQPTALTLSLQLALTESGMELNPLQAQAMRLPSFALTDKPARQHDHVEISLPADRSLAAAARDGRVGAILVLGSLEEVAATPFPAAVTSGGADCDRIAVRFHTAGLKAARQEFGPLDFQLYLCVEDAADSREPGLPTRLTNPFEYDAPIHQTVHITART